LSADQKRKSGKETAPEEQDYCTRILLNEDEWQDPACRVVIGENYKEGLKKPSQYIESDLDAFDKAWKGQGGKNVQAEYHKENAPHLEGSSEWEGQKPRIRDGLDGQEKMPKPIEPSVMNMPSAKVKEKRQPEKVMEPLDRTIDVAGIEVITYALFRFIFGTGVHIPIKREGMVDMDVTVKRKDIIVNTNQFFVTIPELLVWRIIYTHKDKPIMELGRGVKNGMRIYKLNAIRLILEMRSLNKQSIKAKKRLAKAKAAQLEGGME
jgi:hypothetical protein